MHRKSTFRHFFFFLSIISFALFLQQTSADAASLRAIIVCDTQADSIGKSVAADLTKVRQEVLKVSHYIGLEAKLSIFEKNNVNESVVSYLEMQEVDPDDIVIFFFSGHGYRTESKVGNIWPNLYFTPINKGVDFYQIIQIINQKNPRLLIAIADCCNNVMEENYAPSVLKNGNLALRTNRKDYTKHNYQTLFLKQAGTIIVSSSEPGEYSWATKSGGLYTLALFESLNKEVMTTPVADWRIILDNASLKIIRRDIGQTPQYELLTQPIPK